MMEEKPLSKYRLKILNKKSVTLIDCYKKHKDSLPKQNSPFYIDWPMFYAICKDMNEQILEHLMNDNGEFKMSSQLGRLYIRKQKIDFTKRLAIDFHATKLAGKNVYYINEDTDNAIYRFAWSKSSARCSGRERYTFKPCRFIKRRLTNVLREKKVNFY